MAEIVNPDGRSPYRKYGKRPYDYSAMYARAPHLRKPLEGKVGAFNPYHNPPLRDVRVTRPVFNSVPYDKAA